MRCFECPVLVVKGQFLATSIQIWRKDADQTGTSSSSWCIEQWTYSTVERLATRKLELDDPWGTFLNSGWDRVSASLVRDIYVAWGADGSYGLRPQAVTMVRRSHPAQVLQLSHVAERLVPRDERARRPSTPRRTWSSSLPRMRRTTEAVHSECRPNGRLRAN